MTPNDLLMKALFGILLPALVAGITWGLAWKIWNRNATPLAGGTWAGALAVGLAMIAGYLGSEGWPGSPPHTAIGWLPFISFWAIVAGVVESLLPRMWRLTIWLPVAGEMVWVLTATPRGSWGAVELFLWCGALIAVARLLPLWIEAIAERHPGASIPLALWVWSAGVAGALAMTGSILYGHLAGILAATMGAALVVAWIKPTISFARGGVATVLTLGMSFIICGYFYSDLPATCALILAFAPVAFWFGELSFVSKRQAWMAVLMRASAVALPVILSLLLAAWPMIFPKTSTGGKGSNPEADFYK